MTAPVCYLMRADRGARILGLRVVSLDDQASWQSPNAEPDSAPADAKAAAEWLADRLNQSGKALSRLVIDPDGGVCSWVNRAETNPELLRTLVEQPFVDDDAQEVTRFPDLPGETALEPLDARDFKPRSQDDASARAAVLALPVVPARLLLDELDRVGIRVEQVESFWQSLAQAWDPSARASLGGSRSERVISEMTPVTAIIALDPCGRLIWVWSRGGSAIAGGSQRIDTVRTDSNEPDRIETGHTRQPVVSASDLARLGSDWLAWSMQLGVAPTRIVVVGDPVRVEAGLDMAGIGQAFARLRPDVPVDLVSESDPVGATLSNLSGRDPSKRSGINELTDRPGRVHRGMYRWSALALLLAAIAVAIISMRFFAVADSIHSEIDDIGRSYLGVANENNLSLATASLDLERKIEEYRQKNASLNSVIEAPRPMLEELEALSLVLASEDIELREISMSELSITVKVQVAQTEDFEALNQAIRSVSGSIVEWRSTVAPRGNLIECTFTGSWPSKDGET